MESSRMKAGARGSQARSFEDAPLKDDEERPVEESNKAFFPVSFDYMGNSSGIIRVLEMIFCVTCAVCAAILCYMYPVWHSYRFPFTGLVAASTLLLLTSVTGLIWLLTLYILRAVEMVGSPRCFILTDMIFSSLWLILFLIGSIIVMVFTFDRPDPVQIVAGSFGFMTVLSFGLNLLFLFMELRLQ